MAPSHGLRPATLQDLEALLALEQQFPSDRLSRKQLRHLITRAHAETWVAEQDGRVIGDMVVLLRRGFRSARLYTIVVHPDVRGQGVGASLLACAEDVASRHGCIHLSLEVREDNDAAIALYRHKGFETVGRASDYYQDHSSALRMRKDLHGGRIATRSVPYYPQSLEFTCGAASLMMAMRALGLPETLDRSLELALWRESTTVFMLSGHGGCSAHGLAAAAMRRGFSATVVSRDAAVPFLDSVRRPEKKDVVCLTHKQFLYELQTLGGRVEIRDFRFEDVTEALERGGVPLLLLSGYRFYGEKVPHWVVITGFDDDHLFLHDPYVMDGSEPADALNLALERQAFEAVSRFGKARHRYMVVIEPADRR